MFLVTKSLGHLTQRLKRSLCAFSSMSSAQTIQNDDIHANQLKYMEENCIVVDTDDKPIRPISKRDCHFRDPVLHRAFSVFLFTKCSRMILQKRSVHKVTFPSVWTNSCCSHPLWNANEMAPDGDSSLGVCNAAKRKLKHELGIEDIDIASMNVMRRFIYKAMSDSEWGEYELDYIIVVPNFDVDRININSEEVEQIAVVDREKLKQMLASGEKFSPWFELLMKGGHLHAWWDNLDRLAQHKDLSTISILN